MPKEFDHGLVVVERAPDGTSTVSVCARVVGGRPVHPLATHTGLKTVEIAPDVRLASRGSTRYSHEMMAVYTDERGVLHIANPQH